MVPLREQKRRVDCLTALDLSFAVDTNDTVLLPVLINPLGSIRRTMRRVNKVEVKVLGLNISYLALILYFFFMVL